MPLPLGIPDDGESSNVYYPKGTSSGQPTGIDTSVPTTPAAPADPAPTPNDGGSGGQPSQPDSGAGHDDQSDAREERAERERVYALMRAAERQRQQAAAALAEAEARLLRQLDEVTAATMIEDLDLRTPYRPTGLVWANIYRSTIGSDLAKAVFQALIHEGLPRSRNPLSFFARGGWDEDEDAQAQVVIKKWSMAKAFSLQEKTIAKNMDSLLRQFRPKVAELDETLTLLQEDDLLIHLGIILPEGAVLSDEAQARLAEIIATYNLPDEERAMLLAGNWSSADDLLRGIEILEELKSYGVDLGVGRVNGRVFGEPGSWNSDQLEIVLDSVKTTVNYLDDFARQAIVFDRYQSGTNFHLQEYEDTLDTLAIRLGVSKEAVPFVLLYGNLTLRIDHRPEIPGQIIVRQEDPLGSGNYVDVVEDVAYLAWSQGGGVITFSPDAFFSGTKQNNLLEAGRTFPFTSSGLVTHEESHQILYRFDYDVGDLIQEIIDSGYSTYQAFNEFPRSSNVDFERFPDIITNLVRQEYQDTQAGIFIEQLAYEALAEIMLQAWRQGE